MPHTSTPSSTPTSGHPPQSPIALPAGCRKVRVELGERGYDVCIGAGLLDLIGGLTKSNLKRMGAAGTAKAFIAADEHLPIAAIDHAAASLYAAGFTVTATRVRATEQHKSLAALDRLLTEIAVTRHERWDPIIALGGGIVGDLTGLAAAMYRRGVPVIQCPTTLLSMVDASVGGKTGVNLDIAPPHPMAPAPQAFSGTYAGHSPSHSKPSNHLVPSTPHHAGSLKKNLLGIFHQPSLVIADVTVLASLPDRIFRSGLAECVKHGMIGAQAGDPGLFDWTASSAKKILARDVATLTELVARNVAVKASIVAGDEREEASDTSGPAPRALLNLGHTFGHAIETIHHLSPTGSPSDAPLSHGEAISLGLVAATAASIHAGLTNAQHAAKLAELLTVFSLPTKVKDLPSNHDLHALMLHDKKTSGGRLRLVLPTGNATASLVNDPAMSVVDAGWAALRHPIG